MKATILIGGDVYPVGNTQKAFMEGKADLIFHDLLDDILNADLSVVNLECPLVSHETPIAKSGPVLGADTGCIYGFVTAKWQILNLANNHSFDHGAQGLLETLKTIKRAGLSYVGAGPNIEEARKPLIKEINGRRIILYSMAESEFSVADKNTPGSNPLDLINFVNAIRKHGEGGTFIVLIHGGKEYYPYPSPEMVRRCRFMIDMGADAVICCHTHCPLPWEIYNGCPIVYGLGNLVFESLMKPSASFYEGYLAKLTLDGAGVHFEAIPYIQSLPNSGAQKMDGKKRMHFLDEMEEKSKQVKDATFLENRWKRHCLQQKDTYLSGLFGYNKCMRKFKRLLMPLIHSKEDFLRALHLVQCETHREVLNTIFKAKRER